MLRRYSVSSRITCGKGGCGPGSLRGYWADFRGLRWYTPRSMLRRAPERTSQERLSALEEANRVRFARADAKRGLKSGEVSLYDLLMEPSEELKGAKVEEILLAVRGMGRVKVTKIGRAHV